MNVYFWQRSKYLNNKHEIPGDLKLDLTRHSKTWLGGCDEAEINVKGSKESLLLLLNIVPDWRDNSHRIGCSPYGGVMLSRVEVEVEGGYRNR